MYHALSEPKCILFHILNETKKIFSFTHILIQIRNSKQSIKILNLIAKYSQQLFKKVDVASVIFILEPILYKIEKVLKNVHFKVHVDSKNICFIE